MLSVDENEMLTKVDAGTPVGELMRRYWHPVATSQEIKENPVKAVRLLGESLTLFQDRQGRLGLIDQRCAHRRVDLKYGIPENEGLRCPYHGWLYDRTGQCLEQPAETEKTTFKNTVKLKAYSVQELGGLFGPTLVHSPRRCCLAGIYSCSMVSSGKSAPRCCHATGCNVRKTLSTPFIPLMLTDFLGFMLLNDAA